MSRRKSREMALQTLFQLDYNTADKEEALQAVLSENNNLAEKTKEYTEYLVDGTQQHLTAIDQIIAEISNEWKIDRMANVVINEAVELAKIFGTEESSRFVNGILGALVKKSTK
jgi:N utilization substance protein B